MGNQSLGRKPGGFWEKVNESMPHKGVSWCVHCFVEQ
jgi:hypothetical protein